MNLGQLFIDGFVVGGLTVMVLVLVGYCAAALYEVAVWFKHGEFREKAIWGTKTVLWSFVASVAIFAVTTLLGLILTLLYRGVTFYL